MRKTILQKILLKIPGVTAKQVDLAKLEDKLVWRLFVLTMILLLLTHFAVIGLILYLLPS